MKTFGQVIVEARKAASLTQNAVAERLRRADGRRVLPPWLNDLEHDRRYPPENPVIRAARSDSERFDRLSVFSCEGACRRTLKAISMRSIEAAYRAFAMSRGRPQHPTNVGARVGLTRTPGAWA